MYHFIYQYQLLCIKKVVPEKLKEFYPNYKSNMPATEKERSAGDETLKNILETLNKMNNTLINVEIRLTNVEKGLAKVEELEGRVVEVEESQTFISGKYEEIYNKINNIDKEKKRLDKENNILMNKITTLESKLEEERRKRISLEQYGRREMVEISGIPESEGENCINIAHHICETANTNIPISKIEIAHRIMNGSIIVKFTDRPARDLLFKNKTLLKDTTSHDLGYEGPSSAVYINESLAFDTRNLLREVKKKCREIGYKRVITDNGVIKIKKDKDTKKWIKILHKDDLDNLD